MEIVKENGANDGARTRDNLDHNQGLYQLSYVRHVSKRKTAFCNVPAPVRSRIIPPYFFALTRLNQPRLQLIACAN